MDKPLAHGLLAALRYVQGLVPLAGGLAAWQVFGPVKSPYFPPPSAWFEGIMFLARSGKLRLALEATIFSFLAAIVLACVIGFAVGVLIGRFRFLRRALTPLFEFCRGMPPPVLVPVVVLVLGYAESLKLLIIVWIAVWPILLNTASAAGLLDDLLIDVSRTFRLGPFTTLYKIVSPAVVPAFLTGVRIAIPLAIILTLLIEMLTSLPGIGSLIVTSQRQFRSAEVYGLLVLVGILGLAADLFFGALERAALRRWPPMVQNL